MCSIGEDDFGDEGGVHSMVPSEEVTEESIIVNEKLCNKCKKPQAIYKLPFREAECRECFLHYTRHKFRAALGSSRVLPKNANVVLVYDGSAQSLVLLDMLYHAQKQNAFKRLHCNVIVLYIDDNELIHGYDMNDESYRQLLNSVKSVLDVYDIFKCFVLPMVPKERAMNLIFPLTKLNEEYFIPEMQNEKQALINSIKTIKSLTSRQDFLKHHRSKLLAVAANYFKCKFAFMADISSDLASDLLSAVALGKGGSAALDVTLVDSRLGDGVLLCRPLKDLSAIEIDMYVKARQLHVLQCKRYGCDDINSTSIQNLTKAFVLDLQQNFSSTVSTVFRTGSKIATNQDISSQIVNLKMNPSNEETTGLLYCSFCNSTMDCRDSTTLLAIEFSRVVSESCYTLDKGIDLNKRAEKNLHGSNEEEQSRKLCHGCRNIYADTSDKHLLV